MKYIIYTDGAYSQMNDEGAYAFVILTELNNEVKRFAKKITHETNNRAELKAIINAIIQLPQDATNVIVNSDSQYALNTLSGKWKRKLNKDLFDIWDDIIKERGLKLNTTGFEVTTETNTMNCVTSCATMLLAMMQTKKRTSLGTTKSQKKWCLSQNKDMSFF